MPISHFLGPQRPTLRMEITALDDIVHSMSKSSLSFSLRRVEWHFCSSSHRDIGYFMWGGEGEVRFIQEGKEFKDLSQEVKNFL